MSYSPNGRPGRGFCPLGRILKFAICCAFHEGDKKGKELNSFTLRQSGKSSKELAGLPQTNATKKFNVILKSYFTYTYALNQYTSSGCPRRS